MGPGWCKHYLNTPRNLNRMCLFNSNYSTLLTQATLVPGTAINALFVSPHCLGVLAQHCYTCLGCFGGLTKRQESVI